MPLHVVLTAAGVVGNPVGGAVGDPVGGPVGQRLQTAGHTPERCGHSASRVVAVIVLHGLSGSGLPLHVAVTAETVGSEVVGGTVVDSVVLGSDMVGVAVVGDPVVGEAEAVGVLVVGASVALKNVRAAAWPVHPASCRCEQATDRPSNMVSLLHVAPKAMPITGTTNS